MSLIKTKITNAVDTFTLRLRDYENTIGDPQSTMSDNNITLTDLNDARRALIEMLDIACVPEDEKSHGDRVSILGTQFIDWYDCRATLAEWNAAREAFINDAAEHHAVAIALMDKLGA